MSIKHYQHVWKNYPGKKGSNKLVFLALAEFANEGTDTCWPGVSMLAEMAGVSDRQVQRILRELQAEGYIEIGLQTGRSNTNVYRILMEKVTPMTPFDNDKGDTHVTFCRQKGDIHDTLTDTERVTSGAEKVTYSAEKVTYSAIKGDMGVTRTVIEPEKEPEEKLALPSADGLALLMARGTERFEQHRRNGGVKALGWQAKLNGQLDPKLRVPLVDSLAQACGLTAAMADDTIFRELHEYAVLFHDAGYQTSDAIQELKNQWLTDSWRKKKHPMPSLISFFKFGSQQAEISKPTAPISKSESGKTVTIFNQYTGKHEERTLS